MKDGQLRNLMAVSFNKPLINFMMGLLGLAAAYFTTINNIEVQLAEKAESALVSAIDKRLDRLEIVIKEGRVSKDEFFEFKNNIESRLTRIEFYLQDYRR
jgi:hypothetical protein